MRRQPAHLLWSGVQLVGRLSRVVDSVLLAARDPDLHLEHLVDLGHPLKVLDARLNVFAVLLLGKVQHVAREEGLAVDLKKMVRS
jgi:hypothetical protein